MSGRAVVWAALLAVLLAPGLAGCGGPRLAGRIGAVEELIATAQRRGARQCAPVELAMAESHADFARQELAEGRYYQARDELSVAETSVHQALRKSPESQCAAPAPEPAAAPAPAPVAADPVAADPGPVDSDSDGLLDDADKCPADPEDSDGYQDDDGCPDPDNDHDGVADAEDACPRAAEDRDAFEDEDGCPDCDNDGDGVPECPEIVDMCPNKAAQTADGCPEYKLVVVTKNKIELKQTVYFATNKAIIKRVSYPLLEEVGQVLKDHESIHVRIEGHTDSRGSDRANIRLSQARAEAVRAFLVERGIDPARMVAKGYGELMPIADNRTEAGRSQNRRVEFVITAR